MERIGLLSDTHGYWDDRYENYFKDCSQIWHAGDIGSESLAAQLANLKPLRAVYGNIDGPPTRGTYPKMLHFTVEQVRVMITHIGGYPGHYPADVKQEILHYRPNLLVSGHSHILRVMFDQQHNCLCMNPGAAGKFGFHKVRTLLRFEISGPEILHLEVIELG